MSTEDLKDDAPEDSADTSEASAEGGPESSTEKPRWAELMKEVTLTGLATVFMTEDSIRGFLKDKKLPKEFTGLLMDGLSKKKEDFYALLAKEFGRVLSRIDLTKEASKFLEQHDVTLETKITFSKRKVKEDE